MTDNAAALRQLRDCGSVGVRTDRTAAHLFALAVEGLAGVKLRQIRGHWWRIYSLSERGRDAAEAVAS